MTSFPVPDRLVLLFPHKDFDVDCYAQRRLSGGSHSYGGESPRLSPCSSMGKLSKSDEQLSSLDRDSGQCSRNTSCETLGGCGGGESSIRRSGGMTGNHTVRCSASVCPGLCQDQELSAHRAGSGLGVCPGATQRCRKGIQLRMSSEKLSQSHFQCCVLRAQ